MANGIVEREVKSESWSYTVEYFLLLYITAKAIPVPAPVKPHASNIKNIMVDCLIGLGAGTGGDVGDGASAAVCNTTYIYIYIYIYIYM